jgi:hypothetical protein
MKTCDVRRYWFSAKIVVINEVTYTVIKANLTFVNFVITKNDRI